ncbi:MAG: CehA/McbA family metallohydrolase [Chloroflexi bacterium]|nr:CehA/McbA family metallohydrolase [Chloroflexota bacterium]MCL5076248.1 CehA/McbA family metallohydrolase [Chloroflexota bacterium]
MHLKEGQWYKGDLHCHSQHSDGVNTPAELIAQAISRGLHFLSITDHNTVSQILSLPEQVDSPIILIPGQEVSTYYGHCNVWGTREWIDFRARSDTEMNAIIKHAHSYSALVSVCHPKHLGPDWEYKEVKGYDCFEVWQAPWFRWNHESLHRWQKILNAGGRITAVGGSDLHRLPPTTVAAPYDLGTPTTWVQCSGEASLGAILEGIKQGSVFISENADGPQVFLTVSQEGHPASTVSLGKTLHLAGKARLHIKAYVLDGQGKTMRLVANGHTIAFIPISGQDFIHELTWEVEENTNLRLELFHLRGSDIRHEINMSALTNPVYIEVQTEP